VGSYATSSAFREGGKPVAIMDPVPGHRDRHVHDGSRLGLVF